MKCREKLDLVLMRKYSQTEQKKNEAKKISTALLIDSLYQNTNYFKEVISECTDFKNKNPKHNEKPVIGAQEEIKIENYENIYIFLIIIKKLFVCLHTVL